MVLMMGPELILSHVRGTDCVEKKKKINGKKESREILPWIHYYRKNHILYCISQFSLFKCFIQQAEDNVQDTPPHSISIRLHMA